MGGGGGGGGGGVAVTNDRCIKGPLMSIFVFNNRNVKVQLLRRHWMHFVRDHSAGCYKCGDIKGVCSDETLIHHRRKTAVITLYKPSCTFTHFN